MTQPPDPKSAVRDAFVAYRSAVRAEQSARAAFAVPTRSHRPDQAHADLCVAIGVSAQARLVLDAAILAAQDGGR